MTAQSKHTNSDGINAKKIIGEEKIKDKKERQNIFVLGWLRVGYPARGQFIENIMEIKFQ